jgi:hypothetical protein
MPPHPLHETTLPDPLQAVASLVPGPHRVAVGTPAVWVETSIAGDKVVNLRAQLSAMCQIGERLACWPKGLAPRSLYTNDRANRAGMFNHHQGIQRLGLPGYAVLSGGDPHSPMAHLFVLHLASRAGSGMWGSNLSSGLPRRHDVYVARIDLNATLWHAGGMALLGDVLAVPLENSDAGGSRIEFLDFREPTAPVLLNTGIARPRVKAGAVALTRLPDGHFLTAVWSDSEKGEVNGHSVPKKHLDLYRSGRPDLLGGWEPRVCIVDGMQELPDFQTIALLWDVDEHGVRKGLYLLGFDNAASQLTTQEGPHVGHLYSVTLPGSSSAWSTGFSLTPVQQQQFHCTPEYANMDAATGTYVSPGGVLSVYCADHFIRLGKRNSELAQFEEYTSITPPTAGRPVVTLEDSRIELFDGPNYADRPLLFSGRQAHINNLHSIRVGGKPFGRRISSVRYLIPAGFVLVLYREPNQKGTRPLVLRGNGHPQGIADLAQQDFADVARSCDLVAERVARTLKHPRWFPSPP